MLDVVLSRRGDSMRTMVVAVANVMARCREGHDSIVVRENVRFMDSKLKVEHIQELPLDPAHIALAKDTGAHCPVNVFQCRVIAILVCKNECSQEYTLARPLLKGDLQVGLGAVDIDKGYEEDWDLNLGLVEDVGHKLGKVGVVLVPGH